MAEELKTSSHLEAIRRCHNTVLGSVRTLNTVISVAAVFVGVSFWNSHINSKGNANIHDEISQKLVMFETFTISFVLFSTLFGQVTKLLIHVHENMGILHPIKQKFAVLSFYFSVFGCTFGAALLSVSVFYLGQITMGPLKYPQATAALMVVIIGPALIGYCVMIAYGIRLLATRVMDA